MTPSGGATINHRMSPEHFATLQVDVLAHLDDPAHDHDRSSRWGGSSLRHSGPVDDRARLGRAFCPQSLPATERRGVARAVPDPARADLRRRSRRARHPLEHGRSRSPSRRGPSSLPGPTMRARSRSRSSRSSNSCCRTRTWPRCIAPPTWARGRCRALFRAFRNRQDDPLDRQGPHPRRRRRARLVGSTESSISRAAPTPR